MRNLKWTRVFRLTALNLNDVSLYDIDSDLEAMENARPVLTDRQRKKWEPKFDPRKVKVREWRLKLEKI